VPVTLGAAWGKDRGCIARLLMHPEAGHVVVWSFDAGTSRWPSGWNVSAQTFESCAWESVA
jgi:hypothetical protein